MGGQDEIAQAAWGVLVAAQRDGVTDLSVIAHAIARNVSYEGPCRCAHARDLHSTGPCAVTGCACLWWAGAS